MMRSAVAALALAQLAPLSQAEEVLEQVHILFRHGARYPNFFDPTLDDFWATQEPLGQPVRFGCSTKRGVEEMEYLGAFLRGRYVQGDDVVTAEFVSASYDQFEIEARSDLGGCKRRVISTEAVLTTMFPGEPVPILTESPAEDNFFEGAGQCPSWTIHSPESFDAQEAFISDNFLDLAFDTANQTGLGLPYEEPYFLDPFDYLFSAYDSILMAQAHGYTGYDEWLAGNDAVIQQSYQAMEIPYGYKPPSGERGRITWDWAKHILDSFQSAIDGEPRVPKVNVYGSHSNNVADVAVNLGAPFVYLNTGDTFIFEMWRENDAASGEPERRIKTHFVKRVNNSVIDTYVIDELDTCSTVECDSTAVATDSEDFPEEATAWLANMNARIGEDSGCCKIGPRFIEEGCDKYFSDEASESRYCTAYRQHCPEVACGPRGVVDAATKQCVRIARRRRRRRQ